jgi:Tol biopolymer transport system component
MGEVYRARDLRLNRELAIKVLPASIAKDPEFLARFQSEARAASALNHPNIVTIHDIGSADGVSFILMELVIGKTVRELLDAGPPPLKKTVQIAAQAAEGLAAAHAKGIVHRDLKPENLMVSKDGVVKILDFGLAKTTPLHAGAGEVTGSYEAVGTQPGSVLGTVGYMSPEQASGRKLDFRSDQFSFGTILYEMVTGKRAWKRNSAAETLTAIIREDPHPLTTAAPGTPTALRWIVDRCLAKDPEERYASTRDLARDLATLKDHFSEVGITDSRAAGSIGSASRGGRRTFLMGALVVVALGAGIFLAPLLRSGRKQALANWIQVGFRRGAVWSGRFAPDGQTIVYSAAWDGDPVRLFSTRPEWTQTRTLDLPPGKILSISPKSELAFLSNPRFSKFFTQPGTLVRAGLEAGAAREILENVQAADWSPDGAQLAVARAIGGKVRLEYPLGKTLYETQGVIGTLRISRDGAWIAISESNEGSVSLAAIRVADGRRRVLSEGWFASATGLAWSADGHEIWFTPQKQVRDSSPPLLAVTLSGKQREIVRGPGQLRLFDIASDGRLLIARWDLQVSVRGSPPAATRDRELSATDDSLLSDLSNDGRTVLFYDRNALFLRGTDGSPPMRLGEGFRGGRLSPDGKWALALSDDYHPALIPVGAGDVRRMENECDGAQWFPDGKRILCEITNPPGKFRLIEIELASGKATEIAVSQPAAAEVEYGGLLSPDGAFLSAVDHRGNILIVPLAGGPPRRIPSPTNGLDAGMGPIGWTADGQRLFIYRAGEVPTRIQTLDLATGRIDPWKQLTLEDLAGVVRIDPVAIAPDGRSWAFSYVRVLSNLYVVEGLK